MVGRLSPLSLPSIIVPSSRPSRPLTCPRWRSPTSCPAALPPSRPSRPLTCQAQVDQVANEVEQQVEQQVMRESCSCSSYQPRQLLLQSRCRCRNDMKVLPCRS